MIGYLDTSAAMKLLVDEPESAALLAYLSAQPRLVASWLLHTELHCAANRHPEIIARDAVTIILDSISLVDLTRGDLLIAGTLAGRLRSNDALHLTTALRVGANDMISYGEELLAAARAAGLTPVRPT